MRYRTVILVLCLLAMFLFSAGCSSLPEESGLPLQGTASTQGNKVTPTPTPVTQYGSVTVSSSPLGAVVYLDEEYVGTTMLTLHNVTPGTHNLVLSLHGYKESNFTITVTANKATTVTKTLQVVKPVLALNIESATMLQTGMDPTMEVIGTVTNSGDKPAYNLKLTITVTPKDSSDKNLKVSKTVFVGTVQPGQNKGWAEHLQLKRGHDYKGSISSEYEDDGEIVKGPSKSF